MRRFFTFAFATLLVSSPALAEQIPQLDPTWFASQLFWLVICFGVLIVIVTFQITPGIRRVLEDRDTIIRRELHEAESYKTSAEAAKGNFEGAMLEAREQSAVMLAEANKTLKANTATAEAKHEAEMAARIQATEKDASAAVARAIAGSEASVTALVEAMAKQLLGSSVEQIRAQNAVKKVA
jgi:F-type H+-transporting ATPase subunit b